jgi:hypothetical protein
MAQYCTSPSHPVILTADFFSTRRTEYFLQKSESKSQSIIRIRHKWRSSVGDPGLQYLVKSLTHTLGWLDSLPFFKFLTVSKRRFVVGPSKSVASSNKYFFRPIDLSWSAFDLHWIGSYILNFVIEYICDFENKNSCDTIYKRLNKLT